MLKQSTQDPNSNEDKRRAGYLICKEKIAATIVHLEYLKQRWTVSASVYGEEKLMQMGMYGQGMLMSQEYQYSLQYLQILKEKCWELV